MDVLDVALLDCVDGYTAAAIYSGSASLHFSIRILHWMTALLLQVLLRGVELQPVSAAWLVFHLTMGQKGDCDSKTGAKMSGEFCDQLVVAGGLPTVVELLCSSQWQCKAAGKQQAGAHHDQQLGATAGLMNRSKLASVDPN